MGLGGGTVRARNLNFKPLPILGILMMMQVGKPKRMERPIMNRGREIEEEQLLPRYK